MLSKQRMKRRVTEYLKKNGGHEIERLRSGRAPHKHWFRARCRLCRYTAWVYKEDGAWRVKGIPLLCTGARSTPGAVKNAFHPKSIVREIVGHAK